ncbi:MAG: allantoinase [Acidobacteria bacterium]|nr:allantoinase [Acidobacteriota bacterium]
MAKLALIYGMRLFPADELQEVREATVVLKDGRTARITMHLVEGSLDDIRKQFDQSIAAFFEFYPEI